MIHCNHDELRDLGIISVGHRISILKAVYTVKVAHDVPIEADHYVPVCTYAARMFDTAQVGSAQKLIAPSRRCRRARKVCNAT